MMLPGRDVDPPKPVEVPDGAFGEVVLGAEEEVGVHERMIALEAVNHRRLW
jgi:hypothetical protein